LLLLGTLALKPRSVDKSAPALKAPGREITCMSTTGKRGAAGGPHSRFVDPVRLDLDTLPPRCPGWRVDCREENRIATGRLAMRICMTPRAVGVAALALTVAGAAPVSARHGPRHAGTPGIVAAIERAACTGAAAPRTGSAVVLKAEVLLDQLALSPGVIDGKDGDNLGKAIAAFQLSRGLKTSSRLDRETFDKLCQSANAPAVIAYTVTDDDGRGPFRDIPATLEGMARLDSLSYRRAAELLAEKFHTTEATIRLLNPGKAVDRAGTVLTVPNVADERPTGQAVRIEADKSAGAVRVLGRHDELLAFYPASIGSTEKPAPSGTFHVLRVVRDPTYHYDPKFRFKGVRTDKELVIAPGPNNPVGLVWIGISKATYGLHGTSHPDTVGKTGSHGCVRMTNWDALDLARRVRAGTPVAFLDRTETVSSVDTRAVR
jgi:lipoprotein-anchoring transpeptidase ErfK/SrfK